VLAQRVAALCPAVKVLFISGYADTAIVHHGVLVPGVAFLQKPFAPASVAWKVHEVLAGTATGPGRR
jgi:two-component system, cell cycle sensor histidine kinase and response regulator CckA